MKFDRSLLSGSTRLLVLSLLAEGDCYGYQIIRDVPGVLGLTESTLYPVLKRLEAAGHVSSRSAEHNGRLRKYYRITDSGRARLAQVAAERAEGEQVYDYIGRVCHD